MGRMNGCAVWTSRSLSLPRSANRHADCDSNRQPDAHVAGNHAEDSSQCGTQGDSYSRISWLACEQLVDDRGLVVFLVGLGFHIHRLRFGLAFLEDDLGFGLALLPDG